MADDYAAASVRHRRRCCDTLFTEKHDNACENYGFPLDPVEAEEANKKIAEAIDMINHPPHYADKGAGVECIDVVELFNFNMGNAIKYIWRTDDKGDPIENLRKAEWYIKREIERRTRLASSS